MKGPIECSICGVIAQLMFQDKKTGKHVCRYCLEKKANHDLTTPKIIGMVKK